MSNNKSVETKQKDAAWMHENDIQAELVVIGEIFTGEGAVEEAMAVKDGKIIYVGTRDGVQKLTGSNTQTIQAEGTVLPGFTEGHAHVTSTYEILNYAVLYEGETKDDYIRIMKDYLQEHPKTGFLMGRGYRNGAFDHEGPRADMLDEVSMEIPIVAIGEDAHSMWVNTKALELAGIDENSREVPGGEIVRDAGKKPTGWLKEAADSLISQILPPLEPEKVKEAILHYQKTAMENGITHVFEPMLNSQRDYEVCVQAYEELAKEEKLLLNYQVGYMIYPGADIEQEIRRAEEYRRRAESIGSDRYSLNTIKLFIDGVLEGHTAFLLEPYADRPESCGEPLWTQERLDKAVCMASERNFQVHIHTIGDGALDMAIRAFREAQKRRDRAQTEEIREEKTQAARTEHAPHAVTHVQIVKERQFEELAELGVAVVVNPYWHTRDELYYDRLEKPYLGERRAEKEYPVASFLKAGCIVSQASDFPVTCPADIMTSLHQMVYRYAPDDRTKVPLNPEEAVSLFDALEIMTINGAKQGGIEQVTGSLQVGKDADFVILDKKILTRKPCKLYTAKVQKIFIKGKGGRLIK